MSSSKDIYLISMVTHNIYCFYVIQNPDVSTAYIYNKHFVSL